MQTIRKKTSPLKYRNEPGRFFGDGVSFKAKLIGILEVGEARGDRMCQEALQDLKMAIRAAGEHKQRITIHVTIDGLRLRDEKTGDSLYHHPVHKISFIAQDMTDSRAFGYIFGSPDSGHRFFGIKTDKAASQVVLAMRDLFQVVFELKKKEIELARQHIQSKITAHEHQAVSASLVAKSNTTLDSGGAGGGGSASGSSSYGKNHSSETGAMGGLGGSSLVGPSSSIKMTAGKSEKSPESVADLVDLEQELSCIQRGITQMERITPSEGPGKSVLDDDPFGDSFANIPPSYNLLPPPESSKRHQKQTHRSTENLPTLESSPAVSSTPPPMPAPPIPTQPSASSGGDAATGAVSHSSTGSRSNNNPPSSQGAGGSTLTSSNSVQNDDWLNSPPNTSRFDPEPARYSDEPKNSDETGKTPQSSGAAQPSSYTDVFTDLDPLGTGKIKPYIDKKYFFQELKNPPKKVLKDLSGKESTFNANFAAEDQASSPMLQQNLAGGSTTLNASNISTLASGSGDLFKASFDEAQAMKNNNSGEPTASGSDGGISSAGGGNNSMPLIESLVGSGSKASVDPFMEDDDFSKLQLDPFEVHFSRNASPRNAGGSGTQQEGMRPSDTEETSNKSAGEERDASVYNGPLQVNLPPESWASYISQKRLERQTSEANAAQAQTGGPNAHRNRPAASSVFKQNTVDVISSLSSSSKKMKPNLFGQKFSKRDSNSINMRRLQESDSLSETEMAPEPPPRPDSGSHIEPPPLPPKKQFADIVIRPSPRASHTTASSAGSGTVSSHGPRERYDYVGSKYDSNRSPSSGGPGSDAPPLPLPSRKVGRTAGETVGPGRPQKKCTDDDDYLAPIGKMDIPTLLPPPQRKDASKTTRITRKQSETDPRNLDEPTPPPTSKSPSGSGAGGHFSKELDHHHQHATSASASFLPDITLSQLLTLGIDELATKLNVPVSKLSTMTLVELTTYLSEFIENSKYSAAPPPPSAAPSWATSSSISQDNTAGLDGSISESPVFKVNFDDVNEAMFVAKFDDNFGEDERSRSGSTGGDGGRTGSGSFVANFDNMNLQPSSTRTDVSHSPQPVIDKYAVFREIIEQEIGPDGTTSDSGQAEHDLEQQRSGQNDRADSLDLQKEVASEMNRLSPAFIGGEGGMVGSSPLPTLGSHSFGGSSVSPLTTGPPLTKIDTKITQVISQAKDRYAALRDIILVEDLFEKPAQTAQAPVARMESSSFEDRELDDDAKFEANFDDMEQVVQQQDTTSPEINISDADMNEDDMQQQLQGQGDLHAGVGGSFRSATTPREDLEIDELMQKAVSNLSLHSNDQLSPAPTGSNAQSGLTVKGSPLLQHTSTSPYRPTSMSTSTTLLNDMIAPKNKSPTSGSTMVQYETLSLGHNAQSSRGGAGLSDMSTSPIPPLGSKPSGMAKSPILKPSPMSRRSDEGMRAKPTPAPRGQSSSDKRSSGSMSDGDGESSPEGDNNEEGKMSRMTPTNANESWAVFDQPEPPSHHASKRQDMRHEAVRGDGGRRSGDKNGPESPCSSDPKDEWTKADLREYGRRWPSKGHTSSSSRDVSPWDEEGPDYRKRTAMHPSGGDPSMRHHHPTTGERYHHPRMPPRRINSNDEDYEDEIVKDQRGQQRRRMKSGVGSRSRDNFEDEHWYHDHHVGPTWSSPTEDEDTRGPPGGERGSRSFDRNAYERSTYGPPYEKREPKSLPPAYDRRDYKSYDKRKYYREREPSRGGSGGGGRYDYDPYVGDGGYGGRRPDYDDGMYERSSRDSRAAREYFYERERKSFDRESIESYDSRERQRSFGSGDIYGSLDSRAEYRERDRYLSLDKSRSLRRGLRNAGSARLDQDLDQDSEGDLMGGMVGGGRSGLRDVGGNSLHRSSQNIGRGSKQQQQQQMMMMLDDDVWGVSKGGASAAATMPWKRPSSATEQQQEQRRYNEGGGRSGRGMVPVGGPGSDGEKDRRFRKKSRTRAERKEIEMRSNYATMRYPVRSKEDYFDFDTPEGARVGAAVDDDDEEDDEDDVPGGKNILDEPLDDSPAYYGGRRQPQGGPLPGSTGYYGKSSTPRQEGRSMNDALIAQEAKKMARYEYEEEALRRMKKSNSRDLYFETGSGTGGGYGSVTPPKGNIQKQHAHNAPPSAAGRQLDFEFDEFADPSGPPVGGDGFESDFNSPPIGGAGTGGPIPGGRGEGQKSYRFSSDFSNDKERGHYAHDPPGGYHRQQHYKNHPGVGNYADTGDYPQHSQSLQQAPSSSTPPPAAASGHHHHREQSSSGSKLRFNENVTVSKFDAEATTMFEDDFAGRSDAEQDPEDGTQQQQQGWSSASIATSPAPPAATSNNGSNKKILKTSSQAGHHQQQQHQQQQLFNQDNIRKSDSINIFAKKVDDPFEDDDFFSSSGGGRGDPFGGNGGVADASGHGAASGGATGPGSTGWDKNFANFDDNI
ncbi:protein disabled isoform X2 [Anopheles funestus]|uniref:protein disabled isoform X2 n=1 Tax=Anopheles funestus TaxID=62324 RepID=UPI0020C66E83|nr:protein disabled isoform X2 [Anopheles funestus]XP_049298470.1 protein disabled isoform X2 [Anopheles funestus]XP_049298472.1 protein disabled isoform X2 [Anopheles funestus]